MGMLNPEAKEDIRKIVQKSPNLAMCLLIEITQEFEDQIHLERIRRRQL